MKLYLMYILILFLTIIFFIIIKDKIKALKITGILTISSSILLIIISLIVKILINTYITSINLSTITNSLFIRFANTSLILFLIGIIEIIISKHISFKKISQE